MKRAIAMILCLFLLAGCGSAPSGTVRIPPEEDRLTIYTSHKEAVYGPIVREFEERTGIWVQVEAGGTSELLDRLSAEKDAPECDLFFGGGADSLTACRDLFEPYTSPLAAALDPAFLCEDGCWTPFSIVPIVLIYNPVLVRLNPPEGWESLLDPALRGRIAFADPLISGSSYTALSALTQVLPGSWEDNLDAFFYNLNGRILDGSGDVPAEVADGSRTIGITLEETALKAAASLSDVALLYPKEGTVFLPDGMAVVSNARHAANARQFIDFCLGGDVQRHVVSTCLRRPVRRDIDCSLPGADELAPFAYDLDQAAGSRGQILSRWRQLRGDAP